MSQTELAKQIEKSFSTVNAYCCNRQQPTLEILSKIACILNVSIKDLLVDK
ncbi:helix-turn-helix transcriptional regulator [Bacteroides fragilis]